MRVYYDPSCLIALYCTEPLSPGIRAFVGAQDQAVVVNELQELEFRNGLRQKVLRKEINESDLARSLRLFDDDCVAEKLERKPLSWPAIYAQAETISRRHSPKQVCRAFDLLHVAVAVASEVRHFASLDDAQRKLARAAGLRLVEFPAT